jgi:signal transduction histidine kinase
MGVRTPDSGFAPLDEHFDVFLRALPFILLALPLMIYTLSEQPRSGTLIITAGVALLAATWIVGFTIVLPARLRRPWVMRGYLAGLIVASFALAIRSPWFAFFTWIGFLHAFYYAQRAWRWMFMSLGALAFAIGQSGGFHRPTVASVAIWLVLAVVDIGLVGVFGMMGMRSQEQNQARKGMIAELAEANQRLEEMVAENTGLQAQLLTQAREAGVLEERQRMAREIHDTLAQGLTGIVTQLEAAQRTRQEAEHERRISNAKQLARDSLAEARRSVQALRPQALEGARLPEALAEESARWSATSGVSVEVTTTGEARPLHPEVEVTLLRVAQEALANVAKHAGASHAGVTLSYMEDVVTLDVRDDGSGFMSRADGCPGVSAEPSSGGFGLTAMRQRVKRLAGQLEIESEPGSGTAVSASVPAIPLGGRS